MRAHLLLSRGHDVVDLCREQYGCRQGAFSFIVMVFANKGYKSKQEWQQSLSCGHKNNFLVAKHLLSRGHVFFFASMSPEGLRTLDEMWMNSGSILSKVHAGHKRG